MSRKVPIDGLADAIQDELTLYSENVATKTKKSTKKAMRDMVKLTKEQQFKRDRGKYRKAIASRTVKETLNSIELQWYVKPPRAGLSHLLEHGHAKKGGGRTVAYGFIGKSFDQVEEAYLKELEEAIGSD